MLADLLLVGGLVVAVLGLFEVSVRLDGAPRRWTRSESVIRAAMRGREADAVRAEFRRSGICPPDPPRPAAFL